MFCNLTLAVISLCHRKWWQTEECRAQAGKTSHSVCSMLFSIVPQQDVEDIVFAARAQCALVHGSTQQLTVHYHHVWNNVGMFIYWCIMWLHLWALICHSLMHAASCVHTCKCCSQRMVNTVLKMLHAINGKYCYVNKKTENFSLWPADLYTDKKKHHTF